MVQANTAVHIGKQIQEGAGKNKNPNNPTSKLKKITKHREGLEHFIICQRQIGNRQEEHRLRHTITEQVKLFRKSRQTSGKTQ